MKKMSIETLRVINKLNNVGLTDAELGQLEECHKTNRYGIRYLVKKGKYVFGIEHEIHSGNVVVVNDRNTIPVPCLNIKSYFFTFPLTEEEAKHINYLLYNMIHPGQQEQEEVFASLESIKKYFLDYYFNGDVHQRLEFLKIDDLAHYFWLFDKQLTKEMLDEFNNELSNCHEIRKILYVFERKNTRYSLSVKSDTYFHINIFSADMQEYDYIDQGRFFYGKIYLWDMKRQDVDIGFLGKIGTQNSFILVDMEMYNRVMQKYSLQVQKDHENELLHKKISENIAKKVKNLDKEGFVFNHISFTKDKIQYQDQMISGTFTPKPNVYFCINSIQEFIEKDINFDDMELDFTVIWETFSRHIPKFKSFHGCLGSIKIDYDQEVGNSGKKRILINTIRVNKNDVADLLKCAIDFSSQEDYMVFLKKISKCNLEVQTAIDQGITFKYDDSITEEAKYLNFKVERYHGINYLVCLDQKYKISNMKNILSKSTYGKTTRYSRITTDTLIDLFQSALGLNESEILMLFEEGLKEYELATKKSEELLKNTIEIFHITEVERESTNGYLITGKSGKRYFLTKGGKVYDDESGRYICIVDQKQGSFMHNDKLVSRMYALANDLKVAKDITTLNL